MFFQLWKADLQHPGMREKDVIVLLWIGHQVIYPGHGVGTQWGIPAILLLHMNLPVLPFHTKDIIAHVDDEPCFLMKFPFM